MHPGYCDLYSQKRWRIGAWSRTLDGVRRTTTRLQDSIDERACTRLVPAHMYTNNVSNVAVVVLVVSLHHVQNTSDNKFVVRQIDDSLKFLDCTNTQDFMRNLGLCETQYKDASIEAHHANSILIFRAFKLLGVRQQDEAVALTINFLVRLNLVLYFGMLFSRSTATSTDFIILFVITWNHALGSAYTM